MRIVLKPALVLRGTYRKYRRTAQNLTFGSLKIWTPRFTQCTAVRGASPVPALRGSA
jgi:hypothetical protein